MRFLRAGRALSLLLLALCLILFYAPILLCAGSVLTSQEGDPVAHMLFSLGDDRPSGRFFPYFDLAANTRMWGQDVKYHPLHLIRLVSIGLGANLAGWGIFLMAVHGALFVVVAYYSRRVLRASTAAALTGAAAAFFSVSWLEWVALVYWAASAVLLAVSLGEYGLFIRTGRRRHLLLCVVANALQPYVSHAQALIPGQVVLFGAVLLMALYRKGSRRQTILPWILRVWPLTALGWAPILAPVLFSLGTGLVARESARGAGWGLNGSAFTSLLGLLCPSPAGLSDLLMKLGVSRWAAPPNSFLFGSFLFAPALLALWQSGRRGSRILATGMGLYIVSLLAAELIRIPSPMIRGLGFHRAFLFPVLSGFVVAAGMGLNGFGSSGSLSGRILHRLYLIFLAGGIASSLVLWAVGEGTLTQIASRQGLLGSGTFLPRFLHGARGLAAGIALGLLGYFAYRAFLSSGKRDSVFRKALAPAALGVAIVAPALGFGVGQGWYLRAPELETALSPPSEFRFLRDHVPSYEYRVGVILSSDLQLAEGNWQGFWATVSQPRNYILSKFRENDLRLRQGLAFALPALHFLSPVHSRLRREGNPFLQRPESPEASFLSRRNVIVRPEAEGFEEYGVRYWLSNHDLDRMHPGKFIRVYAGEHAAVFENRDAKPVAFLLEEPTVPLSLTHLPYGIAVRPLHPHGGLLSLNADLRGMQARAVGSDGRATALALQPSGPRWIVQVPPGSSAVLFTARESGSLNALAVACSSLFLLLTLALARGS